MPTKPETSLTEPDQDELNYFSLLLSSIVLARFPRRMDGTSLDSLGTSLIARGLSRKKKSINIKVKIKKSRKKHKSYFRGSASPEAHLFPAEVLSTIILRGITLRIPDDKTSFCYWRSNFIL